MQLPWPPEGYPTPLRLTTVPAGTAWLRIQHCRQAPNGQFGVLYASDSVEAAFAETFGRDLMATHAPAALKFLSGKELKERCLARLWVERELQLIDFTGPALQALNLDARLLHTCDELENCQHWALWLHDAPEQPDGILYPSRLFPSSRNVAVFERCSTTWREEHLGDLLSWPDSNGQPAVYQILDDQGWGLVNC